MGFPQEVFTVSVKNLPAGQAQAHETALYHFGTDHAECNVHLIRYLCKNTEETGHEWSYVLFLPEDKVWNLDREGLICDPNDVENESDEVPQVNLEEQ